MKRPPFKIRGDISGVYRRDGKFITAGRLTWCWENLVMAIASGLTGPHEIRRGQNGPWYRIDLTVEEAEQTLDPNDDFFGKRRVARARKFRERSTR